MYRCVDGYLRVYECLCISESAPRDVSVRANKSLSLSIAQIQEQARCTSGPVAAATATASFVASSHMMRAFVRGYSVGGELAGRFR